MAGEILILEDQTLTRGGTQYTFAFLIPSTPRASGVPYTPTADLHPGWLAHLSPAEKTAMDSGNVIFHVGTPITLHDGHTDADVEVTLQRKFAVATIRVPQSFASIGRLAGTRYDARGGR